MKKIALAFTALTLASGIAFAESHEHHHAPAAGIYAPAMEKMHKDMSIAETGDADADFVRGMVPHHQGAIDMAKVLKEKGQDPELQKLADEIIVAQEKEIAFMQEWLKKNADRNP